MTGFETRTGVPAAWYPDPQGPPLLRWWDGSGWSSQTMDPRRIPPVAPPFEPSYEPEPPTYVPMASVSSGPSIPARRTTFIEGPRRTGSPHTASVWIFALYPLIYVVVTLVVGFVVGSGAGTLPQLSLAVASLVVTLILCGNDGKTLRDRGYQPPGWGWGLVPIVYFILRMVRVGRGSLWPFLVWAAVQFLFSLIVVLAVLFPLLSEGGAAGRL